MAKVTLGKRPESFKKAVSFTMLDGNTGTINVNYKYRTRTEFGQMIDDMVEQAKSSGANVPDGETLSMHELMDKMAGQNAAYILNVVQSWDLDIELNADSAQQLADELPAAAIQIMEDYRIAVTEGRLGN